MAGDHPAVDRQDYRAHADLSTGRGGRKADNVIVPGAKPRLTAESLSNPSLARELRP